MLNVKKYAYDPTGENPNNRIVDEIVTIETERDRFIILHGGTFYSKKLVVRERGTGKELDDEDYILNYINTEVSILSGIPAYTVLAVTNAEIIGDLLVSYQVVGGKYVNIHNAIEAALKDLIEQDNPISWENILNKPATFPPELHTHTMDDLTGVDGVVDALNGISASISGEYPGHIDALWEAVRNRVPNVGRVRRAQQGLTWTIVDEQPLWVHMIPYPGAITVNLYTWDIFEGGSTIEVSGELKENGSWDYLRYNCLSGKIAPIEMVMTSYDGSSADLLIRLTNKAHSVIVLVDKICYYLSVPEHSQITLRPMSEYPEPIPSDFYTPVYPWET